MELYRVTVTLEAPSLEAAEKAALYLCKCGNAALNDSAEEPYVTYGPTKAISYSVAVR